MAPVYALVLGFALVLLAWALLPGSAGVADKSTDAQTDSHTESQTNPQADSQTRDEVPLATFMIAGDGDLPEDLRDMRATILHKNGIESESDSIGASGQVLGTDPDTVTWVCVQLPRGWKLSNSVIRDEGACVLPGLANTLSRAKGEN